MGRIGVWDFRRESACFTPQCETKCETKRGVNRRNNGRDAELFAGEHVRIIVVEKILHGGLFALHDVAVDEVDHVLGFMTDVVGNVFLGDIEGQHDRDGIVP